MLQLEHATFRLGDRFIFPDTNWFFGRGQQWAIVGPNGSGKSLFADCLRGQLPLVKGELHYGFTPPKGLSAEETIGYVGFDERRKLVHGEVLQSRWNSLEEEGAAQVREHLSYERVMDINPYEVRQDDRAARSSFARRLRDASRLLEIEGFWDRALLSLSNGERQRIELVRALCRPLRLLILDEPLGGLDRNMRKRFIPILERLMRTSLPVLVISTRPEDLPKGVTHILEINECRLAQADPKKRERKRAASELVQKPAAHSRKQKPGRSFQPARERIPLVQMRNLTIRYGQHLVLNNLNWTIWKGESWALLGPNGSGKSTLLGLIAGDHPQAYTQDVSIFGRQRGTGESVWEIKEQIGSVSPELQTYFSNEATCFEVIASGFFDSNGLFESPSPAQRRATRSWLKRFKLDRLAGTPLFQMSTGLQRMALLARALVKNPQLLLLDEPCQGLDLAHRLLFIHTVDRIIHAKTATVVYVTHREDEIPPSIKRVLNL